MRSWSRTARVTPPKDMPAGFPMPAGLPPGMTTQQVATARVLRARHASSRRLSEVGAVAEAGAGSLLPSQASSLAEASDGSRRRASRVRFAEEEPSTSSRKGSSASIPALEPDTPTAPRYNAASFLELVTTTQVGLPPKATRSRSSRPSQHPPSFDVPAHPSSSTASPPSAPVPGSTRDQGGKTSIQPSDEIAGESDEYDGGYCDLDFAGMGMNV